MKFNISENDKSEITKKCCTLNSKIQKFHALKALENHLCDAVKDFSVWYLSGSTVLSNTSEINLFSLILNFIQLASIKQINTNIITGEKRNREDTCHIPISTTNKLNLFVLLMLIE